MSNESVETNGLGEIRDRLSNYENEATTSELYDFGKMLVSEGVDRARWLDAKAGILAGFFSVTSAHDVANRKKAGWLTIAQWCLFAGGALLSFLLLAIIWSVVQRA